MRQRIRQLFRPTYGAFFITRPKHWWNPSSRRAARIAATVADHNAPRTRDYLAAKMTESLVYGTPLFYTDAELKKVLGL